MNPTFSHRNFSEDNYGYNYRGFLLYFYVYYLFLLTQLMIMDKMNIKVFF